MNFKRISSHLFKLAVLARARLNSVAWISNFPTQKTQSKKDISKTWAFFRLIKPLPRFPFFVHCFPHFSNSFATMIMLPKSILSMLFIGHAKIRKYIIGKGFCQIQGDLGLSDTINMKYMVQRKLFTISEMKQREREKRVEKKTNYIHCIAPFFRTREFALFCSSWLLFIGTNMRIC